MAFYRRLPIVIEAFQWTGGAVQTEDPVWMADAIRFGTVRVELSGRPSVMMVIGTLEGAMTAFPGDWIIKGVNGELYPCKPEVFAKIYELVGENQPRFSDGRPGGLVG